MSVSLQQIAQLIGANLVSAEPVDGDSLITGINSPGSACDTEITFIASTSYLKDLEGCRAVAAIIHPDFSERSPIPSLIHKQPYMAYALASKLFTPPRKVTGVHPTVILGEAVELGANTNIGANAVIGDGAKIGAEVNIGANTVIGDRVSIGNGTCLLYTSPSPRDS